MKFSFALFTLASCLSPACAQPTNSFALWPHGAPGALGKEDKDIPTITTYFPDPAKATGAALVICPGGGYAHLTEIQGGHYWRSSMSTASQDSF